jgi:hypothetical protein
MLACLLSILGCRMLTGAWNRADPDSILHIPPIGADPPPHPSPPAHTVQLLAGIMVPEDIIGGFFTSEVAPKCGM